MSPAVTAVPTSRRPSRRAAPALALLTLLSFPGALSGQNWVRDFVIAAGLSTEAWSGDFSAIAVPQFDSAENAVAGVGEWSVNGIFRLLQGPTHVLEATVDGGIRQSVTAGFRLRNYAPREQTGSLALVYTSELGGGRFGRFTGETTARSRRIIDHPPMPLYKSPGYDKYVVQAGYEKSVRAVTVDVKVAGEDADYKPPPQLDHLDKLDRSSVIVEAGGRSFFYRPADPGNHYWGFRFFGAYGYHRYPRQGEGEPRADHAIRLGGTYTMRAGLFDLEVTLDGTRSRSTSRRVEYNHGSVDVRAVWTWGVTDLSFRGTLARKRYVQPIQYALVAGEEADNASVFYAELTRRVGSSVDGAFQIGWRRVETNFSGAYYTRFGGGFSMRWRPWE